MSIRNISIKLMAIAIALGVPVAIWTFCGASRTEASAVREASANFGLFSLGAGQTARLIITTPVNEDWQCCASQGRVVLGFNVFRPSTTITPGTGGAAGKLNHATGGQAPDSCLKHHMTERQSCQVTLGAGEAASFEVTGDGVSHFQPVVMLGDGSVRQLGITLEVMEGGRTLAVVPLPAVQKAIPNGPPN